MLSSDRHSEIKTWIVGMVALTLLLGSSRALAQSPDLPDNAEGRELRIATLRADAASELAKGNWVEARNLFDQLLTLAPQDSIAQRDAGRAGMAAGDFDYAARVLEQAHHFAGHHRDPELHYLRGESLYALGRVEEARDEHRIAELEIGTAAHDRMSRLWLARVYVRRGELARADVLYESLWTDSTQGPDAEVAFNHADAHLLMRDWAGAERLLRRFLERSPKHGPDNIRARHMLAWALESKGDLEGELSVRAPLATDDPTSETRKDYGRALERAGEYDQALRSYQGAAELTGSPDATLVKSCDRMRYRLTPEVAGGLGVRTDPTTTAEHLQAGAALPFGSLHLVSMIVSHDEAQGGWPAAHTSVSAIGASLLLGAAWGGTLMLGGQARGINQVPMSNGVPLQSVPGLQFGGVGEVDTPIGSPVRLNLRAELENQWTEAPIAIRESGAVTGITGHLFVFPIPSSHFMIIDAGTQARRLMLAPGAPGASRPESSQLLTWAGADFVLWQNPLRTLRGQSLDDRLVRPTEVAEALTLGFRHYEVFGRMDPEFRSRIALVTRSTIDSVSMVIRNARFGGRAGFEARGGLGYESTRRNLLSQGGLSLYVTGGAASRVSISYDFAQETSTGLTGRRHSGWVAYHVDI